MCNATTATQAQEVNNAAKALDRHRDSGDGWLFGVALARLDRIAGDERYDRRVRSNAAFLVRKAGMEAAVVVK